MYGAALQELREERPEERRRAVDVDADDRRPVRRLVPGQQVAGEALARPIASSSTPMIQFSSRGYL